MSNGFAGTAQVMAQDAGATALPVTLTVKEPAA
jgi:hypothetical protein